MVIGWEQSFNAKWTLKGMTDNAKYSVAIEIEGQERDMMTDVSPIIDEINDLEGKCLSSHIGKSSLEAVTMYVRKLVNKFLEKGDKLKTLKIIENDFFLTRV
ncbi:MAG: hypothetical protein GY714_14985 [Desulfobacterales bacterium]|nr:hypothetical protein [Desulfobacterales bacterium]